MRIFFFNVKEVESYKKNANIISFREDRRLKVKWKMFSKYFHQCVNRYQFFTPEICEWIIDITRRSFYSMLIHGAWKRIDVKMKPRFDQTGGVGGWGGDAGTAHWLKLGQASTAVSVTHSYSFTVCPLELPAAADHEWRHRPMTVLPETPSGIC